MRRQEMARRRRNLSEKRNEEVKVRSFKPLHQSYRHAWDHITNNLALVSDGNYQQASQEAGSQD